MRPALPSSLVAVLALAACGQNDEAAAPSSPEPINPVQSARQLTPEQTAAILATLPSPYDVGDLENGRRVFARCRSCHTVNEGGRNMIGPNLWGVFGRMAGTHPDYRYSNVVRDAGFIWDAERLDHWLANPREFMPGNKMSFAGVRDDNDRRDLIAWLKVETGYAPETPAA
jgi:cytochrome c